MAPKMKGLVRAYLDWRKKNPGQGTRGVQQVIKMMGLSPRDGNQLIDTLNDMVRKKQLPRHLALESTDKWYKDQPEWGTKESNKKARAMTPGQIDEEEYDRKRDRDAERGIPRKKVMSFSAHSKMSDEEKAKRKANYKKAMAASLANVKKQFKDTEVDEGIRSALYKAAKFLGDVNAVKKGKVKKRIARRVAGKATGRMLGKLFK